MSLNIKTVPCPSTVIGSVRNPFEELDRDVSQKGSPTHQRPKGKFKNGRSPPIDRLSLDRSETLLKNSTGTFLKKAVYHTSARKGNLRDRPDSQLTRRRPGTTTEPPPPFPHTPHMARAASTVRGCAWAIQSFSQNSELGLPPIRSLHTLLYPQNGYRYSHSDF